MKNEERRMYTLEAKALAEEQKRLNPDCWKRKRTNSVSVSSNRSPDLMLCVFLCHDGRQSLKDPSPLLYFKPNTGVCLFYQEPLEQYSKQIFSSQLKNAPSAEEVLEYTTSSLVKRWTSLTHYSRRSLVFGNILAGFCYRQKLGDTGRMRKKFHNAVFGWQTPFL